MWIICPSLLSLSIKPIRRFFLSVTEWYVAKHCTRAETDARSQQMCFWTATWDSWCAAVSHVLHLWQTIISHSHLRGEKCGDKSDEIGKVVAQSAKLLSVFCNIPNCVTSVSKIVRLTPLDPQLMNAAADKELSSAPEKHELLFAPSFWIILWCLYKCNRRKWMMCQKEATLNVWLCERTVAKSVKRVTGQCREPSVSRQPAEVESKEEFLDTFVLSMSM